MNICKQFSDAADTYADLLENSGKISCSDDILDLILLFKEKIENDEFLEETMTVSEIINSCNLLHTEVLNNKKYMERGFIVVLDTGKKKIVLDGNHRLNTLNIEDPDFEFKVFIIDGVL